MIQDRKTSVLTEDHLSKEIIKKSKQNGRDQASKCRIDDKEVQLMKEMSKVNDGHYAFLNLDLGSKLCSKTIKNRRAIEWRNYSRYREDAEAYLGSRRVK
ncbi:MAG: hypothetical protein IPL98_16310 [Saprospiraceae bacterium]|nr:hypothetical protein [Saprospiraceae bacterium]